MHRRVAFLLFAAGWGANHFATLLVVYRRELGLSPADLGILFGAYAIGLVPGLILAGRLSDRWGRRALVLPATLASIVASGVLAFGGHGTGRLLLVGRLLYGLAMGCVMSPGSVWLQELSPPELGARRATLALSAGFGLGPLVSGVIAEFAPAPMVLPYVAHAVLTVGAFAWARSVPDTTTAPAHQTGGASGLSRLALSVLARLTPMAPWSFGLASITCAIVPGLMRPYVSRPILYSGFVIVTTLFAGVLVQPLTARLGRRADLLGLGIGIGGILLSALAIAWRSPPLVFVAAPLVGAGYGLVMTVGLREITARVPARERGTAVGVYYVLTYVGFALPFVHATAARQLGDTTMLVATAGAAALCLGVRALVASRPSES